MPKIDNPIADQEQIPEDQPEYPGLQIEDNRPAAFSYPPPDINTLISPYIVPTKTMPYNRVGFFTFPLTHGQPAIRVVEAQPIGIAGRVTLYTTIASARILVANKREMLTATTGLTTSQSFSTPITNAMQPITLYTCAEIWAEEVSAGTDSEINIILETFDIDLYMQELGRYYPYDKVSMNQIASDY